MGDYDVKLIQTFNVVMFVLSIWLLYILVKRFSSARLPAFISAFVYSFFISVFTEARYLMTDAVATCLLLSFVYLLYSRVNREGFWSKWRLISLVFALGMMTRWTFVVYTIPFVILAFKEMILKEGSLHRLLNQIEAKQALQCFLIISLIVLPWYITNFSSLLHITQVSITPEVDDPQITLSFENMVYYLRQIVIFQTHTVPALIYLYISAVWITLKHKTNARLIRLFTVSLAFVYILFTFFVGNKNVRFIAPMLPFLAAIVGFMISDIFRKTRLIIVPALISMVYVLVAYLILSFGWPMFPDYKLILKAPLFGYIDLVYLSTSPIRSLYSVDDWHNEIFAKYLLTEKSRIQKSEVLSYLVLSDKPYFNASGINTYLYQSSHGVPIHIQESDTNFLMYYPSGKFQSEPELDVYMQNIHVVIYTKKSLGNPEVMRDYAFRSQILEYVVRQHPDWYKDIYEVQLPDGDTAVMLRRI